jgi:transcriptional regulator with XRE-family HTH domain
MSISDPFRIYNPQALGEALRHFRQEQGLSQAELARSIGVHQSYLSELEAGKVTEHTQRLFALFKMLGVRMIVGKADW